jgi:hypothetical protein
LRAQSFGGGRRLDGNDYLRLGSTFHSLHAIATQLSPVSPAGGGIRVLDTDTFRLECFQTATGVKFFVVADPGAVGLAATLHEVYELYTDYVLKSPFYELEMPIRCELFDTHLERLLGA